MKKKSFLFLAVAFALLFVFTVSGMAAGLSVNVNEKYSTGEPMLIMITSDQAIDPANISIEINKPNGTMVKTVPRRQNWNSANECFETYTLDVSGNYTISVADKSTGATASTQFSSGVFNKSSGIFMVVSVGIFILSMLYWVATNKKKRN